MKCIVIGSGLIGLTTAYFLRHQGHEVAVIDREAGPGQVTSFANGALLTPSMPEPWNAPGSWRVLLASLFRSDSPLKLRPRALPSLTGWGVRFLRNSSREAFEHNTLSNLSLALHSLKVMETLREDTGIEYGRGTSGTLRIFRDAKSVERATVRARQLPGLSFRTLSIQEVLALEPALTPVAQQIAGAIHYASDETGDAYQFCVNLSERVRALGVELRFRTEVSSIETRGGRVTAVLCGLERLTADCYIVAACSYSAPLLRPLGIDLPVRPAKGYSVTIDQPRAEGSLRLPVIDDQLHAVVTPLRGVIRVAGTAEFAGYDLSLPTARIQNLLKLVRQVLPQLRFDPATARPWCGLRAMSADGVPIIGATALSNLFVNTGHGHLGWTMAAGSSQLLTELLSGRAPSLDPAPYRLARFG
jgi:D-amino-acid dehydrogenase